MEENTPSGILSSECERKFQSYISASPVGIFVLSAEGRYLDVNPAGVAMLGYTKDELASIGMPFLVTSESMEAAKRHFEAVRSSGLADGEFLLRKKDGSCFWARVTASRISEKEFIAFKQDVSDRKRYEQELARAREDANQANRANRAKSLFLANMSHEIRTPLNAIVAMANVLSFTELSEEQTEYLCNIELSVDCLLGIISDVLDISRIEAGKVEMDFSDFSIRRCIEEIVRLIAVQDNPGLKLRL